jgi:hypothetical protein
VKIIERIETVTYTVQCSDWDRLEDHYGEEGAGKFLKGVDWSIENIERDEFGIYMKVTFVKHVISGVETTLWSIR